MENHGVNNKEVAKRLRLHNEWRRGAGDEMPVTPEQLGIDIDSASSILETLDTRLRVAYEVGVKEGQSHEYICKKCGLR